MCKNLMRCNNCKAELILNMRFISLNVIPFVQYKSLSTKRREILFVLTFTVIFAYLFISGCILFMINDAQRD